MTRLLDKVPDGVRERVDTFRFFAIVYGVAIGLLAIGGWVLNARTNEQAARNTAAREAALVACIRSIPVTSRISLHVSGVNDLAQILVQNSKDAIAASAPGDPLAHVRVANLRRLQVAAAKIGAVTAFPVPTVAECEERSAGP